MTQAKSVALGVSNFNSSGVLGVAGGGTGSSTGYFVSGTALVFKQTAAPTGWTKIVTDNDAALRVVSGAASTGGTVGFTTAFASQAVSGTVGTTGSTTATGTVGATTLTTTQIPAHGHTYSGSTGTESANHSHRMFEVSASAALTPGPNGFFVYSIGSGSQFSGTQSANHTHSYSGTTANAGSGGSHDHTFTGTAHTHTGGTFTGTAINLAVKYVDVIVATKD